MDGPNEIAPDASQAKSVFEQRARYDSPANIFTIKRPSVPKHVFVDEIAEAMAPNTATGWIALDVGARMGFDYPATTPMMLGRYARVRAGESLSGQFRASGEIYYGIAGSGSAAKAGETIEWNAGDVFALPGGGETELVGDPDGAVLFQVTNEPELTFHNLDAPSPENAPTQAALYPDAEIRHQMALVHDEQKTDPNVTGLALHFSSERREQMRDIHPSIALAMNSLDAHEVQRPHRHNSVAMTLPIQCDNVYSVIEGERVDWHKYAIMITPRPISTSTTMRATGRCSTSWCRMAGCTTTCALSGSASTEVEPIESMAAACFETPALPAPQHGVFWGNEF